MTLLFAAAAPAAAQTIVLQIRPRVGDTLRMRLDQLVEMTGTARLRGTDSTVTSTTVMRVLAHSIVKQSGESGTTMLAITDSVLITDGAGHSLVEAEPVRRAMQGRRIQLHVAPDGGTQVVADGSELSPELRGLFAQMPATLPRTPVSVGDVWSRTMDIPSAGKPGASSAGTLTAAFRLDSLSRGGDVAHVSMRGTISRDGAGELPRGIKVAQTGVVTGTMAIDRRRGWMTEARTTLTVHSVVTPPGGLAEPMKVRMKVTQWLRAM